MATNSLTNLQQLLQLSQPTLNNYNNNRKSKPKSLTPPNSLKPYKNPQNPKYSLTTSWLLSTTSVTVTHLKKTNSLSLHHYHSSNSKPHRPISATVFSSLPTAKPELFDSTDKDRPPKWSWRAIKSFTMAALEARKLKRPNTGTESLLMGILIEGTSLAAKFLWENGITVFKAHEESIKLLGKADMYYFPPEQPPLTESAQRALDWAVEHKLKSGDCGEINTTDLLLGIWSEVDSPGHKIMATLGFNDEKAKELESKSSGPGFSDG